MTFSTLRIGALTATAGTINIAHKYNKSKDIFHSRKSAETVTVNYEGNQKKNLNVRITTINGVNTDLKYAESFAQRTSRAFESSVTGIHNPSTGSLSLDLVRAGRRFTSSTFKNRENDQIVNTTAQVWRMHFKELDEQSENGDPGILIHIAHSEGGFITKAAYEKLSPEEKKRLQLFILGSPEDFQDIENATECYQLKDMVPRINPKNRKKIKDHTSSSDNISDKKVVVFKPNKQTSLLNPNNHLIEDGYEKFFDEMAKEAIDKYEKRQQKS
jgi:hypothetical protein